MSRFKTVLLCFMILACFSMLGCRNERVYNPGNTDDNNEVHGETKITVSESMFNNCSVKFGLNTVSIGVAVDDDDNQDGQGNENEPKNYLIFFDSNGNIEDVIFNRKVQGKSDEKITYKQIEGSLKQLYLTQDFLFLAYTCEENYSNTINSDYFYNSEKVQSFAIDLETGKVYSMAQFEYFTIECDGVIKASETGLATDESYYALDIQNNALTATDLLPNKNITATAVYSDAYGNIYVKIDKGIESRSGNVFYVTQFEYLKGSDGYYYTINTPSYYSHGNYYYGIDLYVLNENGEEVNASNRSVQIIDDNWSKSYIFCDNFAYMINLYNKSVYVYYAPDSAYYNLQYIPLGKISFSGMQYPEEYADYPSIKEIFLLNNYIILATGADYSAIDSVFTLDLSETIINPYPYVPFKSTATLPSPDLLIQASELEQTAAGLVASMDTATVHTQYLIYETENGIAVQEILSQQYDTNVIFIQPLN